MKPYIKIGVSPIITEYEEIRETFPKFPTKQWKLRKSRQVLDDISYEVSYNTFKRNEIFKISPLQKAKAFRRLSHTIEVIVNHFNWEAILTKDLKDRLVAIDRAWGTNFVKGQGAPVSDKIKVNFDFNIDIKIESLIFGIYEDFYNLRKFKNIEFRDLLDLEILRPLIEENFYKLYGKILFDQLDPDDLKTIVFKAHEWVKEMIKVGTL